MTIATTTDCLVLGGGPAGSTFAATLLRHAPDTRVTILEQARFPRWQVGESVVPVINAQLQELGLFEKLTRSSFVKKIGNVVVWGPTRTPWSPDFLTLGGTEPRADGTLDIAGFDYRPLAGSTLPLDQPVTSFNVRRAEFDQLLLERARELGAQVLEGTRATRIQRGSAGEVELVTWENDRGESGEIRPNFSVDACGLRSPLTRGERFRDPALKHFAVIGYLRGARWKVSYRGGSERTAVFVLSVPRGWIWYIPLAEDMVSVGLVTDAGELRERERERERELDLEQLLWNELESAPELREVVRGASFRDDVLPNGARVRTCQQWSSFVDRPLGPNWVAVGDAAMFVDPIVPSGVGFAFQSGHRAAYTWLTAQGRPAGEAREVWDAYGWYVRGEYGAMSRLAHSLYGNNASLQSRFWQRPELASSRLRIPERCTLAGCEFFPFPKAFGWKVVAPLLSGIAGRAGSLASVYSNDGLPEKFDGLKLELRAPLALVLRSEYPTDGTRNGRLRLYRDVVTSERAFYHRLAVRPADIPVRLEPAIAALSMYREVDGWLRAVPALVGATASERPLLDRAARDVLRVVARRGFVQLTPSA